MSRLSQAECAGLSQPVGNAPADSREQLEQFHEMCSRTYNKNVPRTAEFSGGGNAAADISRLGGYEKGKSALVEGLRQQLGRWGGATKTEEAHVFSCGVSAIDRLLPGGGLRHGMLVEWMATPTTAGDSPAASVGTRSQKLTTVGEPPVVTSGVFTLALLGAREACCEGGVLVVIDRTRTFYPPAAAAWGIDLERTIVVWPQNARDELWAAVQALRSPVVAAMWANIERLDSRAFRRLQLAAEAGRTLGVLVRPASVRGQPSWADVRLEVETRANSQESRARSSTLDSLRRVQVCLTHCRGGRAGDKALLEIDDVNRTVQGASSNYDTHSLSVASQLADPASHSHSARA